MSWEAYAKNLEFRIATLESQLTAATERAEKAEADAARIDWLEGALFDKRWNGVIDSGSRNYWRIHSGHRHATANMQGTTFRAAIDAARAYRSSHD